MRASGGRNTKVRTVPFDANLSVRMETRETIGVSFPSTVANESLHWRNRSGRLPIADPFAGRHAPQVGSPGEELFPVLVSSVTEVPGGLVGSTFPSVHSADTPMSMGTAVNEPFR